MSLLINIDLCHFRNHTRCTLLNYGDKPRPDGKAISLQQLMKNAGFTDEELSKLKEAQDNSDDLVITETVAMNAVKGLYDDGNGNYTKNGEPDMEMARRIMHDRQYHAYKAKIMKPLDEFFMMLDKRTYNEVKKYKIYEDRLVILVQLIALLLSVMSVCVGIFVTKKLLGNISQLVDFADSIACGDLTADIEVQNHKDEFGMLAMFQLQAFLHHRLSNCGFL